MQTTETNRRFLDPFLTMAEEHNIPIPKRADAHPDPMEGKDLSTVGSEDILEEVNRIDGKRQELEREMAAIDQDILRSMRARSPQEYATDLQNHPAELAEHLPLIVKKIDAENALRENAQQALRISPRFREVYAEPQFVENHPGFRENRKKLRKLQEELSNLLKKRQAKEASVKTINGEIAALTTQLSEENKALERMRKGQEGIKKSIDLIRGSI